MVDEKINWQRLGDECQKINKIVNKYDEIQKWKIAYGNIVLNLQYYHLKSSFLKELREDFPEYELSIQSETVIIPLKQNITKKETCEEE